MGIDSHMPRLGDKKNEKEKKDELRIKTGKENKKVIRRFGDGLLLVVPTKIYGKPMKTLSDSGATRCFVTLSYMVRVVLKGIPQDVFLELGNGKKYLSDSKGTF